MYHLARAAEDVIIDGRKVPLGRLHTEPMEGLQALAQVGAFAIAAHVCLDRDGVEFLEICRGETRGRSIPHRCAKGCGDCCMIALDRADPELIVREHRHIPIGQQAQAIRPTGINPQRPDPRPQLAAGKLD